MLAVSPRQPWLSTGRGRERRAAQDARRRGRGAQMRFPCVAEFAGVQRRGRSSEAWDPALGRAGWRFPVPAHGATQEDLVTLAWSDTSQRCAILPGLAQPLIGGVTQDLEFTGTEISRAWPATAMGWLPPSD